MKKKIPIEREFAFRLNDVARMLRTYADQQVRQFGMTRAQWAVLSRLEVSEGLKQSELADMLDIQPITLTRLVDRMCDNGLIERRADPDDRRAKRLYLTPAARPVMDRLTVLGRSIMADVLQNIDRSELERMNGPLDLMKENLRTAMQRSADAAAEKRYG
jgi:MarR family transcriptional regulator, transcriptional regulator for hemolysin